MSNNDTMRGWLLVEKNGRVLAGDKLATLIHEMPPCSVTRDAIRHSTLIAAAPDLLASIMMLLPLVARMVGTGEARGHTIPYEMTDAIRQGAAAVYAAVAADTDDDTTKLSDDIEQVLDGIDETKEVKP